MPQYEPTWLVLDHTGRPVSRFTTEQAARDMAQRLNELRGTEEFTAREVVLQ